MLRIAVNSSEFYGGVNKSDETLKENIDIVLKALHMETMKDKLKWIRITEHRRTLEDPYVT